ncbi:hypothetical protein F2Q69_00034172 [Brassica cretica]|uniref:Uncharacterized protein n=1 Tax=Brassica cretica TaxID=69181 RepID=A0A8S9SA05_BRACR|nr:hypothetical protein F2Q69_00034172 [Brassica cretica]
MGKRKGPKKASSPKIPLGAHVSGSFATGAPSTSGSPKDSKISKEVLASLHSASASELQDPISESVSGSENTSKRTISPTSPRSISGYLTPKEDASLLITASASTLQDPIS